MGHSMLNQPTLPPWPTWIFLIFCQVSVPIKKWKSWKFYLLIMKGFKIMTAWTMDPPSSLDNKPLQFMAFWNCSYSASFNSKHLKFWMGTHFLELFTTKNLFSENFENYTCDGVQKLSNWPLQYFCHILFQWAITS